MTSKMKITVDYGEYEENEEAGPNVFFVNKAAILVVFKDDTAHPIFFYPDTVPMFSGILPANLKADGKKEQWTIAIRAIYAMQRIAVTMARNPNLSKILRLLVFQKLSLILTEFYLQVLEKSIKAFPSELAGGGKENRYLDN